MAGGHGVFRIIIDGNSLGQQINVYLLGAILMFLDLISLSLVAVTSLQPLQALDDVDHMLALHGLMAVLHILAVRPVG